MVTEVYSGMVLGIEGMVVKIQADISDGLPVFHMIGLLGSEVKESKERVRTAFKNIGIRMPPKRISVNLAPADLKKKGTGFDLGIAVSLMIAMGLMEQDDVDDFIILGELALDGSICKVQGTLPILREAVKQGYGKCIIPKENVNEASLLTGLNIYSFDNLEQVFQFFCGIINHEELEKSFCHFDLPQMAGRKPIVDFSQIHGQNLAKRALVIGAAGFHNVFLDGPPGVGKTMLASAVPGILPEMTQEEIIDATMIYSVKGLLDEQLQWVGQRPFRNPGHAISKVGMFGGGADPKPGEISLAHNGVLFLDEFSEYKKDILEMLRIPLEDHKIQLVRNERSITYPSDFLMIAASNPCPCGYYPDRMNCRCSPSQINHYRGRLSGPILDRMDLFVRCEKMDYDDITKSQPEISSEVLRNQVMKAWKIQKERFKEQKDYFNGRMSHDDIQKFCQVSAEDHKLLQEAFRTYGMTGRSLSRVLKVARTIADLEESLHIKRWHLEEALLYRRNNVWEI